MGALLGGFFVNVFGSFVAWLLKFFTQKVAVSIGLVALSMAMFGALFYAMRAALALVSFGASAVHPMFGVGVSMVISPRAASYLSSYLIFWSACEVFKWRLHVTQLWSRVI